MPRTTCLTPDELTAFQRGELPETALDEACDHLERCPACEAAAQALDGRTDSVLDAFRRSARSASPADEDVVPERVGDYEILSEIGRGGMGIVYKARHVGLRRVVALKMLLGGSFADPERRLRFRAEAEAVARLQHPHIVQLFEVGEHRAGDGIPRPYFTLEFVEGGSLAGRLGDRPPPQQVAAWLETLARAVGHAHERGIVHRDLKPSNILLTAGGQPKVCDFGIAKFAADADVKTLTGVVLGTPEYMAPEQAEGKGDAGPGVDVHALGTILYELLTGRLPFKGFSALDTLNLVRTVEPVPPRRLQPSVPRDLETICLKCLNKEPRRRYAGADALAEDVRRYLAGEPIVARPVGLGERAVKWARRRPAQAALAAALVLVTLLGAVGVVWQLYRVEAARAVAVQEKGTAEEQRGRALQLAEELRVALDTAERNGYRANVAAAGSALQVYNRTAARRYLEAAPEKHRNWEWHHFASRLDHAQAVLHGGAGAAIGLAFSPDGRTLATGHGDGTVRLWDVATGKAVAVLSGHERRILLLAFHPDGTRLASGDDTGIVFVWDVAARKPVAVLSGTGNVVSFLDFSPDSRWLGVGSVDGRVHVWDVRETPRRLLDRHDPRLGYRALAFSPDGRRIAVGVADGSVHLWDLPDGRESGSLRGHRTHPAGGSFSPDGTRLVTAALHPDYALRLWNVADGRLLAEMPGHKNELRRLSFSPDGSRIASSSLDMTGRLWDGTTGQLVAVLQGHIGLVHDARFSPTGASLVTVGQERTIRLWDSRNGAAVSVLFGHDETIPSVAFSPDGTRLASTSLDGTARLWDVALAERGGVLRGHTGWVFDVAFTPDDRHLVSAAWDGTVRIWDADSGQPIRSLAHPEPLVTSLALAPDGTRAVSLSRYGTRGHLWDVAAGKVVLPLPLPGGTTVDMRGAYSPKGTHAAAAGHQGHVHLWDAATGRHLALLQGHTGRVLNVAFSPDGAQLASVGMDATVRLWDVATRQETAVLRGHAPGIFAVAYRSDGRLLATGGADRTVRLWDPGDGTEVALLSVGTQVSCVRFHPDGSRLAVACADNTLRLWDVATREEVAELRGHDDYIQAVAFSRDGTRLASCSNDTTVRIWDTLSPEARARRKPK